MVRIDIVRHVTLSRLDSFQNDGELLGPFTNFNHVT
jgi:hypothetical protein